jgi:hypothetical protein
MVSVPASREIYALNPDTGARILYPEWIDRDIHNLKKNSAGRTL